MGYSCSDGWKEEGWEGVGNYRENGVGKGYNEGEDAGRLEMSPIKYFSALGYFLCVVIGNEFVPESHFSDKSKNTSSYLAVGGKR